MNNGLIATGRYHYTISLHDWPLPHADLFLLEMSQKVPEPVQIQLDERVLITIRLYDFQTKSDTNNGFSGKAEFAKPHRLAYLNYSGPVSGDRGTVLVWDQGIAHVEQSQQGKLVQMRLRGKASRELWLKTNSASQLNYEFVSDLDTTLH